MSERQPLIARTWGATATPEGARWYQAHFRDEVVPHVEKIAGYRGAHLMQRALDGGRVELRVISLWESLEAIRAFAGATPEVAVVKPAAQAQLATYDREVIHYEVDDFPAPRG